MFKLPALIPFIQGALMIAALASIPVDAQEEDTDQTEQRLLTCDGIADPAEKLQCFDAVVERLKSSADEPVTRAPAMQGSRPASEPESESESDSRSPTKAAATVQERGDRKNEESAVHATVTRSWRNVDGRFIVELDNGQVWRETQGTRVGIPNEGALVEISEGRFGGHRMKIDDITQIAWVRKDN